MINDKYKAMMGERINATIQTWEQQSDIKEHELYTFLHNIKGTAGSIGMDGLSEIASTKLTLIEEKGEKIWETKDWKRFIVQIEEVASFIETNVQHNDQAENDPDFVRTQLKKEFILVIDDEIVLASYIKKVLEFEGYIVIVAHNGQRGIELIHELRPSLVFLDIKLPDMSGFTILENMNKMKSNQMFVAMMSSDDRAENRVKAFDLGAFDFIRKPLDPAILASYVKSRLHFKQTLELSNVTDELTCVFNRKYMNSQLQQLTEQYKKNGEVFSIAIVDLDFFKKVNDTYGHIVGDEVLKVFSSSIMQAKREEDVFCRYGGEEFVLIMPGTTKGIAFEIMEKLRKIIEQKQFFGNEKTFYITFSSGISEISPKNTHPKALMEQADQALYQAKSNGRNQSVVYSRHEVISKIQKVKLIVIDDVSIIRNLVISYFSDLTLPEGYLLEVEAYENGEVFLQENWYEENMKYIILLDGMMPEVSGMDVLKEIRKEHSSNNVIISMLTGRNDEEYVLDALANGANDFIVKPFNIADVAKRLLHLINQLFVKVR